MDKHFPSFLNTVTKVLWGCIALLVLLLSNAFAEDSEISEFHNDYRIVFSSKPKGEGFDNYNTSPATLEKFSVNGIHPFYQGCGSHYLVIEHSLHNKVLGEMVPGEIENVFRCYREAVKRIAANLNNLISIIFKNQGA